MKIKFLFLCLSCMFLFFLNINCSSSESVTQEDVIDDIVEDIIDDINIEVPTVVAPVTVKTPKMLISESGYAFPDVEEGTTVTHVWEIKNIGTGDLIINDVESSCGCTSAITDSKVIAPNSSTKLRTVFDTKGRLGVNTKFVTVHSNDPSTPSRRFSIMGRVVPKVATKN